MATDYLSALNVGSGLNVTQIVDSLVDAERAPQANLITSAKEKKNTEISALGTAKQYFQTFESAIKPLDGSTGLKTSNSGTSLSIEISDLGKARAFSHNMTVSAVAAAHTLSFNNFASATSEIGQGTLTFDFGKWTSSSNFTANGDRSSVNITVDSNNNTLSGLRDTINNSGMDVVASIIKTSSSTFALVLRSREGENHAMKLSAAETPSGSGLSDLAFTSVDNSIQTIAAGDTSLTIDGTTVTRDSNKITDLIDGATLTVNKVTSSTETVGAAFDTASAAATMQALVDQINVLTQNLKALTQRDLSGNDDGALAGDPLIKSFRNQLRSYTTEELSGFEDNPIYLADYGVKTELDGTVSLDIQKFNNMYALKPEGFSAIVNSNVTSDSSLASPTVFGNNYTAGNYKFELASDGSAKLINKSKVKNATLQVSENTTPTAGEINLVKLTVGSSTIEFGAKTDAATTGDTAIAIKAAFDGLKDKKGFSASITNNVISFIRADGENFSVEKSASSYKGVEIKTNSTVDDGAVRTLTLGAGTSNEVQLVTTNSNNSAALKNEIEAAFNNLTEANQNGFRIARTNDAIQFYRIDGTSFTIHSSSNDFTHDAGNNSAAAQFSALTKGSVAVNYKSGGNTAEGSETIQIDLVGSVAGVTDDLSFTTAALTAGDDTEIITAIKTAFDSQADKKGYSVSLANNVLTFTRSDGGNFTFEHTEGGTVGSNNIALEASIDGGAISDLTSGSATSVTSSGNGASTGININTAPTLASNLKEDITTGSAVITTSPKTTTGASGSSTVATMTKSGDTYSVNSGDANGLSVSISGGGSNANIYLGRSLITKLNDFTTSLLKSNSDIDLKIQRYSTDITEYDEQLSDLDARIAMIRERYIAQFTAMEAAVASLKATGDGLTNMMDAWTASLKR